MALIMETVGIDTPCEHAIELALAFQAGSRQTHWEPAEPAFWYVQDVIPDHCPTCGRAFTREEQATMSRQADDQADGFEPEPQPAFEPDWDDIDD